MKTPGLLFVLSAPSGGGKTTICERLLQADARLTRSVSVTTRCLRPGERREKDYHFADEAAFRRLVRKNAFLERAQVHGHWYGTLKSEVEKKRRAGRDVLLVIDVQGGLAVKRRSPRSILIFVKPPSLEILARRLRGRGTDSRETIRARLQNARGELKLAKHYHYTVVNKNLPEAVKQIQAIILAERLRTAV